MPLSWNLLVHLLKVLQVLFSLSWVIEKSNTVCTVPANALHSLKLLICRLLNLRWLAVFFPFQNQEETWGKGFETKIDWNVTSIHTTPTPSHPCRLFCIYVLGNRHLWLTRQTVSKMTGCNQSISILYFIFKRQD